MHFTFTRRERFDLLKSWGLVSLAFALFMTGVRFSDGFATTFLFALVTAAVTVGVGFLAHELAHKWVANRHGCHAEYRADNTMLIVSLVLSLLRVFIAAPGAVHISGHATHEESGRISLAGPVANLILAIAFLALFYILPAPFSTAAGLGTIINSALALFNMLPFGMFDGAKIIAWSKVAYGVTVAAAVLLTFFSFAFVQTSLNLL